MLVPLCLSLRNPVHHFNLTRVFPKSSLVFLFISFLWLSFPISNGTVRASTLQVPAGGDFQAALNSAQFGDTIILQAGATYFAPIDSFVLPNKGAGTGTDADYITIQTSNLSGISATGQRINPAVHALSMPRLMSTTGYSVIKASPGAHHYRLIGIEITTSGNTSIYTPDLVNFGAYFTRQQRLDTHHIVLDRMFIHTAEISATNLFPGTIERTSGRGVAIGVAEVWLLNSYIAGFCGRYPNGTPNAGQNIDSYGVYSDAGPGPMHIINNYIEAQFNNVFIGGAGMTTPNTGTVSNPTANSATLNNVSNLAVGDLIAFPYAACNPANTGNNYAQPWETGKVTAINGSTVSFTIVRAQNSCAAAAPDNGGVARWKGDHIHDVEIRQNTLNKPDVWNSFSVPKAWIEIKEMRNGVIDGNDMYSGVGTTIALTVRNQDGASPWDTIENVSITNNRVQGYKWVFSLLLTDNEQPSTMGGNLTIANNLFYKPLPLSASAANFLQLVGGHDITVQHNTLIQPGSPVVADQQTPGFVFKDNVIANYQYGLQCAVNPYTLSTCWPNLVMAGNVMIDTRWDKSSGSLATVYPAGNYYPNSVADVGFQDLANDNYALSSASAYRNLASDGTDPGVNMTQLLSALSGSSLPSSQQSTPTPTPAPTPLPVSGSGVASFVQLDTTTQGDWKNKYGSEGYNVINDTSAIPSYLNVNPLSNQLYTWTSSTTAARALQKATSADRIAGCWYQFGSFSVDVNLTDGQTHQMAIYALDWDNVSRSQRFDIVDATSKALIDSQTVTSFSQGQYLVWNVKGHIQINVTQIGGGNAVVSGLFFGGPLSTPTTASATAGFVQLDTTTQGNWKNNYGSDGYIVIGDTAKNAPYAQVSPISSQNYTWASSTTVTRALQKAASTDRIAACWYQYSSLSIDVNLTDGQSHRMALYSLDWDNVPRSERVDVIDASTGLLLDSRTISSFSQGQYLVWNVKEHIRINVTQLGGGNAVVSGLFFGGTGSVASGGGGNFPSNGSSASFLQLDTTTQGNWKGKYGSDGYLVLNDTQSVPLYVIVGAQLAQPYTWSNSTSAPQALQKAVINDRIAACLYQSSAFSFDVNITDGQTHRLAIYALDWDNIQRMQRLDIVDAGTNTLLDSQTMSNFSQGQYLVWTVTGHIKINVTNLGSQNAVVSGIFFGP